MDEDLLRGLDWELEGIEDSDARELLFEAYDQHGAGEIEAALDTLDRALLQAELEVVADDRVLAHLMLLRAACLVKLDRLDEALIVTEELPELVDGHEDAVHLLVGQAKRLHALLLAERGEQEAAFRELTEVGDEFAKDEDSQLRALAAGARGSRIRQLIELGSYDEALMAWEALLADSDDPEESVQAEIALTGKNAAIVFLRQNKTSIALAVADDVIAHFAAATAPDTGASVAVAITCRASISRRRWRLIALYRAIDEFNRFVGLDPEPEVVEAIKDAFPEKTANRMLRFARVYNS